MYILFVNDFFNGMYEQLTSNIFVYYIFPIEIAYILFSHLLGLV